jgi:hypothetical protein
MQSALPGGVIIGEPYTTEVVQTSFVVVPVSREDERNSTGAATSAEPGHHEPGSPTPVTTNQVIGFLASSSTRYCPV